MKPIFLNISIITLLIIVAITSLLLEKGATFSIIVGYLYINASISEIVCSKEELMSTKSKKNLYIEIIVVYVTIAVSAVLYIFKIINSIAVIYELVLVLYFVLISTYLRYLLLVK